MLTWINDLFEAEANPGAPNRLSPGLRRLLREMLRDCEQLYRSAAQRCMFEFPDRVPKNLDKYEELLYDLHRGVLIKILIDIAHCDRRWTPAEKEVATMLIQHVWKVQLGPDALAAALQKVVDHAQQLKWRDLVKPFTEIPELHEEAENLRALILRMANLIAKADGDVLAAELVQLERLKKDLDGIFMRTTAGHTMSDRNGPAVIQTETAELIRSTDGSASQATRRSPNSTAPQTQAVASPSPQASLSPQARQEIFEEARRELNALIGLDSIKRDVEQLVNFLKVQKHRQEHGLPTAAISFHAVFEGNPGTGKTTVARILSRLLCGLEVLETGQTIEVDRSGLVAQYAGQTGPRTSGRVDESVGGVLFIDEAYSLVSDRGEDMFGTEAIQTLLKRMEDDRDRFVVVLAGYPEPMQRMLKSNPGLSSRFQRTYRFDDYSARDLLRIYYTFCKKYHYRLPKPTQRKLLTGFEQLLATKDEHFGNGRLARNLFESSIRHMSSRVVGITPLTRELLTTIEPEDIVFEGTSQA